MKNRPPEFEADAKQTSSGLPRDEELHWIDDQLLALIKRRVAESDAALSIGAVPATRRPRVAL